MPSPKTQVENNLDDEMGIHITKELSRKNYESTKDRRNLSVVTNEQKNQPIFSDFIETTIKESFRGTESRGSENNHFCSPNKRKCDLNYPNLVEKEKDKSTDPPSVSSHNSNEVQASTTTAKEQSREVTGRNNTTRTRNDNDTINRALDQNSENVNGLLSNRAPWCVKDKQWTFAMKIFLIMPKVPVILVVTKNLFRVLS